MIQILYNFFWKIEKRENTLHPNSFYEITITLMPITDKDSIRKL